MKYTPKCAPFLPLCINNRFYNVSEHAGLEEPESLLPSIKMYFGSFRNFCKRPTKMEEWVTSCPLKNRSSDAVVTWLGHATTLIQIGEKNILTDPLFGTPSRLYRRILPFGVDRAALPSIDVVLISHNHRDHMDKTTIMYLYKNHNPLFLVPQGDKAWFLSRGITQVEEFTWWESYELDGIKYTFVPAWHWSQRGLFDHNRSLWGGWVVQDSATKIYFAGDTAYNKMYFKAIGEFFGSFDIALMPIGPGAPDEWMRRSHMSAEQAGQAFLDCNAHIFIPMHWGTFYFGHDAFLDPVTRLQGWWKIVIADSAQYSLIVAKLADPFHLAAHKNSYSNRHDQNRHK